MAYVYLLECSDGSYYTGWTVNLENRVKSHNAGRGARYTRSRRPVTLVYWETCQDRSQALRREAQLKKFDRKQKEQLVAAFAGGSAEKTAEMLENRQE